MNEWMHECKEGRKKNCSSENKIANKIRRIRKHLNRFHVLNTWVTWCVKLVRFQKLFHQEKMTQCNVM